MKNVYIAIAADLLHEGHLNIIKTGASYGDVMVGVLTDEAVASYKRLPYMPFESRKIIVESIKGVKCVVSQESKDYEENIRKYKPDYVVHGDDWQTGVLSEIRLNVIATLSEWGGQLIEVPYTEGISSTILNNALRELGTTPQIRLSSLRRLLKAKPLVRFLDIHNALSGLIIEHTKVEVDGISREFDGMWGSSLTDSTAKGKPDIEAVDVSSRMSTLSEVLEVTTKPIIYDADTGGQTEHFKFTVRTLERLGVSAVIIEDKTGLKKNSLFGNEVPQTQDSIENFSDKISSAKKAQITDDFMVIARIESLILEAGMDDAIIRAKAFLEAGADGIMIHSRKKDPAEILEFCRQYAEIANRKTLVVVPSSYNSITEDELEEAGANVVIYANQLLRSAFPAMQSTAQSILKHSRSLECDESMLSIKEILNLIPGTK
ncbi:phosphoenolpyruvate mutase [Pseudomonadales bacterium]|nr:phosphoenolpyruvate mutase [Pseudomonadales bacterium]